MTTSTDHIAYDKQTGRPTAYVGPKAVDTFRIRLLMGSIAMHRKCGMIPTRGVTITKMMKMASEYTGKKYKTKDHEAAEADLLALCMVRTAELDSVES